MRRILTIGLVCLLVASSVALADSFDQVKAKLARAGCHYFEFYSIIESDIFDEVDTASGTAYISSDGRYSICVADEAYVYDLENAYTYSEGSGQVIVERVMSSEQPGEEIAFILSLDESYATSDGSKENTYFLSKIDSNATAYPDSINVLVDTIDTELRQFEYLDINEELNRIIFLEYRYQENCDSTLFKLEYPDSAEVIRL